MADDDFFKDYPPPSSTGPTTTAGGTTVEDFFGDGDAPPADAPPVVIPAPPPGESTVDDVVDSGTPDVIAMPPPGANDMANGTMDAPPAAEPAAPGFAVPVGLDATADADKASEDGQEAEEEDDDDADFTVPRPSTPDAVKQWRVDFAAGIEERQAHEKKIQKERTEDAAKILKDMHKKWQDRCASNKKINLDYEKKFLKQRDGLQSKFSREGQKPNWNIVPELANMTGEFKKGQRDTSRMRSVIMKLKT
mmetsp:Transcript_20908/g.51109  ORF Transcript_20908/g.51109 Transcript_20908/m.51109 type:complete len:250 (-) Transcript_20908:23-772(-)